MRDMDRQDDEGFCGVCFAGVTSSQHFVACVRPLRDADDARAELATQRERIVDLCNVHAGSKSRAKRRFIARVRSALGVHTPVCGLCGDSPPTGCACPACGRRPGGFCA